MAGHVHVEPAPMLDALAAGLRECWSKPLVGDKLQLDSFLDGLLRSRCPPSPAGLCVASVWHAVMGQHL